MQHDKNAIGPVAWVMDKHDLRFLLEALRGAQEVVMDLETTGLDEHAVTGGKSNGGVAARVSIASLTLPQRDSFGAWDGDDPTTWLVPLSHPKSPWLGQWRSMLRLIARAMEQYKLPFVNHHAKFDGRWITATTGVCVTSLISWDTQSIAFLLDELEPTALKETVPRQFGVDRWDDHDLKKPGASERVDLWELGDYAARDTYWTWRLKLKQVTDLLLDQGDDYYPVGPEEVQNARLGDVATYVSNPTARCLGLIEERGIRLDVPFVEMHLEEQREIAEARLDWLAENYDMDRGKASGAATSNWFKELTEKAVALGELRVSSRTKGGTPQWDKHVLRRQAVGGSEVAKMILEQRDASKQAEFMSSWLEKVTPAGFIHSTYKAATVVTGRLSSSTPNMQQIAKKLRPAFIPRDGYGMADFDYSQLELRIAAFISRSLPMIEAYANGQDLHRLFAADLMTMRRRQSDPNAPAVSLLEVPGDERQKAKAGNFGLLYLQEAEGFMTYASNNYGVELTLEESVEVYNMFFRTWEGMAEWHDRTKKSAARKGFVTSPIGRVRRLPGINDRNPGTRSRAERQAVNSPVQGFGSDIMQLAISSIYGQLPGTQRVVGVEPVGTVHDSLVAEIRLDMLDEAVAEVQSRMTDMNQWLNRMGCDMDVPLVADATVGTRWGLDDILAEN